MADLRNIPIPEHLSEMIEFQLLDEVSEKQMSDFYDEMYARADDILVMTATETGIARREKILRLLPDPSDPLEARRATVMFWWYNKMPYTRRVLERKIATICGDGNYTFDYDVVNEVLHVGIGVNLGWDVVDAVYNLLDELVMLHVILDVHATSIEAIDVTINGGSAEMSYIKEPTISDGIEEVE